MTIRLAVALVFLAACAPSPAPQDGGSGDRRPAAAEPVRAAPAPAVDTAPAAAPAQSDTGRIARLEREARALAHVEGCTAGGCRTAPVGSRPCGGPRTYLAYCAATTDSAALFARLAELARAEAAFNRANGMASTCEYRMPPAVALQGGRCVATESQGIRVQ